MPNNEELLEDVLHHASSETRHALLDAVACALHNDGYALSGNTEAHDLAWFARAMYAHASGGALADLERRPPEEQERWQHYARSAWQALPPFLERIAHRMQLHARTMRTLERAERLRLAKQKPERRARG